jgi:hypothetical protein
MTGRWVREMASTMPIRSSDRRSSARLAAKPRVSYAEEADEPVNQSQQQPQGTRRSARLASKSH